MALKKDEKMFIRNFCVLKIQTIAILLMLYTRIWFITVHLFKRIPIKLYNCKILFISIFYHSNFPEFRVAFYALHLCNCYRNQIQLKIVHYISCEKKNEKNVL